MKLFITADALLARDYSGLLFGTHCMQPGIDSKQDQHLYIIERCDNA